MLPHAAYGKQFLRNISLPDGARFVDSLSYFGAESKRSLLGEAIKRIHSNSSVTSLFEFKGGRTS